MTIDLVDCFGNLGEFSLAFMRIYRLLQYPLLTPEMVRKAETAKFRILAFYEFSKNSIGLRGMKKAMAYLEKVVELDSDDESSKCLLRRMWNSKADKARLLAEELMNRNNREEKDLSHGIEKEKRIERNIRKKKDLTKRAEVAFRKASRLYEKAMKLFPKPVIEGGTAYTLYRAGLGLLDKLKLEQSRWEYQIDVQQKKIMDHRLAILSGELDWNQQQHAYARVFPL